MRKSPGTSGAPVTFAAHKSEIDTILTRLAALVTSTGHRTTSHGLMSGPLAATSKVNARSVTPHFNKGVNTRSDLTAVRPPAPTGFRPARLGLVAGAR
jgi:hypothetical protein